MFVCVLVQVSLRQKPGDKYAWQKEKDVPQTYLQCIAYDSAGNYLNGKYQLLDSEAKVNRKKLQLTYTVQEDGYVDVFIAAGRAPRKYIIYVLTVNLNNPV